MDLSTVIPQLLKTAFDSYASLPITLWESIAALGEVITVKKEEVIKKSDTVERNLYFIIQGSGGILLWHRRNFVCVDMLLDREFFGDYLSFITQQPTPYEVLTFEEAQLFKISYKKFEEFTSQHALGDKLWRYATQALYTDKHYQQLQLLTMTAAERYAAMVRHQPYIVQRIPQKYIASYLGITPQSFSRIRSEIDLQ